MLVNFDLCVISALDYSSFWNDWEKYFCHLPKRLHFEFWNGASILWLTIETWHDRWKAALGRALVIKQVGSICTPGKIVIELCVGVNAWTTHSHQALISPDSQLYSVRNVFFLCQESDLWWFYVHFLIICLCRSYEKKRPEIKNLDLWRLLFLWCEERDNLGLSRGKGALGNVTILPGIWVLFHSERREDEPPS